MNGEINHSDERLMEALRAQSERLEALETHIRQLEAERRELHDSNCQISGTLEELHSLMGEWEWFFEHSLEMMCIAGLDGYFKRVNPAFARTLGYSQQELLSCPFVEFVHPDDVEATKEALKGLGENTDCVNFENRYRHSDGEWHWISWHVPALTPSTRNLYAIAQDVTDRKRAETELHYKACHDSLTGLLNRAAFHEGLATAILRASRNPDAELALYLVDLDGFKNVNDTHGHPVGDRLLRQVAERLTQIGRHGEMVCRLGGDEFAMVIEGHSELRLEPLARRILETICQPIELDAATANLGCCIGISTLPRSAQDADTLISQADVALYSVKRSGKGGYQAFGSQDLQHMNAIRA
jgi:diguanylate cyclase (GGDEF)-like protein/PAS domain S-box-containing protein